MKAAYMRWTNYQPDMGKQSRVYYTEETPNIVTKSSKYLTKQSDKPEIPLECPMHAKS